MTKTVGDIAINVTADIAPLTMAMKQGAKSVSDFGKRTKRVGYQMKRFGDSAKRVGARMSLVSGAFAAAGLAAFSLAKGTADAGKEIINLSKVSGTSTDRFQRMAAASQTVGIEQEKLADILKDVNDKVGDFMQTGGGPMADFFENIAPKVGVTADEFKNLSGPDALQLYYSSLKKANLSQSEMTFYMEALASDATMLSPLLAKNGEEMTRLGNAAAEAGGVLDGKALAASKKFSDEMVRLRAAFEGAKNKLGAALLPIMTRFVEVLADKVIPALDGVINHITKAINWFDGLSPAVQEATGVIAAAFAVGGPVLLGIGLVAKALGALIAATGPIGMFIAAAALAYAAWQKWGDDITGLFERVSSQIGQVLQPAIDRFLLPLKHLDQEFPAVGERIRLIINGPWAEAFALIPQMFTEKMEELFAFFQTLPDRFFEIGGQIIEGLKRGIMEKWESLKETVLSLGDSLPLWMREKLGIHSPSRVFAEIGDFIGQGLAQGIEQSHGLVNQAVNVLSGSAVSGAEGTTRGVLGAMGQMFEGSKKLSAAMALANSWLAFTEVLKDPSFIGRPWARVGAAFAALAPGLNAVKNIKSASASGGGGGATSAGAQSGGASQPAPRSYAEFAVVGSGISGGAELVDALNSAIADGHMVNVSYRNA